MALPFVAGLAVGAGVILAVKNSGKIKDFTCSLFSKTKNVANESFEKGKNTVSDVKQTINATAECIKEKKAQMKEEKLKSIETKEEE